METTIVSHQKSALVFRNRPMIFKGQSAESGSDWETYDDAIGTRWASPDITFTHHMTLHLGNTEVQLEHHPGPGAGAIWVIIPKDRIVFVGDAVTPDQPPFLSNAEIPVWLETLDLLLAHYKDYIIVSGRGGPVDLVAVRSQVRNLKNIHKGLERIAKRNAPPEASENLVDNLLSDIIFPAKLTEQYTQRLKAGLYQYYSNYYRQGNALELTSYEESEV
jgi:glyoxylase-like metal-dependent hydrolase (beta-lactamase superfamily II)